MLKYALHFLGVFFISIAVVKFIAAMRLRHTEKNGGDNDAET